MNRFVFTAPHHRKTITRVCEGCGRRHTTDLGELVCQNTENKPYWGESPANRSWHYLDDMPYVNEGVDNK